jgi:GT2 family glycosyltransferase
VNYRTPELLEKCLESIKRNTSGSFEVMVHDNSPPLPNLGFAKANNILISRSRGQNIVLLNPDTQVTSRWLDHLIETARSTRKIGIVQSKMLRENGIIDSTGHGWNQRGEPYDRGAGEIDKGQYDDETELTSCCFGSVLIKREVFQTVGLLDRRLFVFYEDVEFSLRARKAGWRVVFCPKSVVYHNRHGTGVSDYKYYLPYIILKIYGPRQYLKKTFLIFMGILAGVKNSDMAYVRKKLRQIRDALFF